MNIPSLYLLSMFGHLSVSLSAAGGFLVACYATRHPALSVHLMDAPSLRLSVAPCFFSYVFVVFGLTASLTLNREALVPDYRQGASVSSFRVQTEHPLEELPSLTSKTGALNELSSIFSLDKITPFSSLFHSRKDFSCFYKTIVNSHQKTSYFG